MLGAAAGESGDPVTGVTRRGARLVPADSGRRRALPPLRRQDTAHLDGLVEKSHLFTADPEAASAGRLYRQLARYLSGPSAGRPDTNDPTEAVEDLLADEELLLVDGDFGRRLEPETQSPALPAYPPYSHGPLAVPGEPYRSPEYGPVSGEPRRSPAAEVGVRSTAAPADTVTEAAQAADVPLQGAAPEPPAPTPSPPVAVRPRQPTGYLPRRPHPALIPTYRPAPARPTSPVQRYPSKVAAPSLHKSAEPVFYPPTSFYNQRLNEVSSEPLWSPHSAPRSPYSVVSSVLRSARSGVGSGRLGGGETRAPEYRHYSGVRQAKKLGGFTSARLSPHRHQPVDTDVSFGARTGGHGAFEWFSDHPVGSSHH